MTGVQDGINYGIGWCVAGGLGTGFDGDAYGITIGIDELIEIGFTYRYLRDAMMEILRVLWQDSNMISMMVLIYDLFQLNMSIFSARTLI